MESLTICWNTIPSWWMDCKFVWNRTDRYPHYISGQNYGGVDGGKIKCLSLYLCPIPEIWNNILNIWVDCHIYFLSLSSIGILKVWSRDRFSRYRYIRLQSYHGSVQQMFLYKRNILVMFYVSLLVFTWSYLLKFILKSVISYKQ